MVKKLKKLVSGIFRRPEDGKIVIIATSWKCRGKRERVLPSDTELEDAIRIRKSLIRELKQSNSPVEQTRSSLTFHAYVELYRANTGTHADSSIVNDIDRDIGHLPLSCIEEAFTVFINHQNQRNRMVWRRVNGGLKLCDTGKKLSQSSVQDYKRYFKAICGVAQSNVTPKEIRMKSEENPSAGIKVGKSILRRRALTSQERTDVIKTAEEYYPWFVPVIQFASTMPIRPEDQIVLKTDMIDDINFQIPYLPNKTRRTGTFAYPAILSDMKNFIMGRTGDAECPFVFFSGKDGARFPLTYSRINSAWNSIMEKTGISNLRFYDLRHDAVNYLFSIGFSERDIMYFAGWNSPEMVRGYDTRDPVRFSERTRGILAQSAQLQIGKVAGGFSSTVNVPSMKHGTMGENVVLSRDS